MKFGHNYLPLLLILFSTISFSQHTELLKKGTLIPVRLAQNINGNIDSQGGTVYYEVLNDIKVNGHIVIAKGVFARGQIAGAESRKSMGKAGKLTIDARSVEAVDGQKVFIIREAMNSEGRKRTGATVAHVIMWGPLGLFAKGRAARIMLDSEYDIEVDDDINIDVTSSNHSLEDTVEEKDLNVFFSKYKSKINYAKGKIGKDFLLNLSLPKDSGVTNRDIKITKILNNNLPKPLTPSHVYWNEEANAYTATFAFTDMVKYIMPGTSNVLVKYYSHDTSTNSSERNTVLSGEAMLSTKWKLK